MFARDVLKIPSLVNFRFKNFLVVFHPHRTSVKRQTTMEDSEIRLDKFFFFMNIYGFANDDLTLDLQPRKSDKLLCWPLSLRKFSADVKLRAFRKSTCWSLGGIVSPQMRHGRQFAGVIFAAFVNCGYKKNAPFQVT